MKKRKPCKWTQGYACAIANLMRQHHETGAARDAITAAISWDKRGLRIALAELGVPEYDLEAIDPAFPDGNVHDARTWRGDAYDAEALGVRS